MFSFRSFNKLLSVTAASVLAAAVFVQPVSAVSAESSTFGFVYDINEKGSTFCTDHDTEGYSDTGASLSDDEKYYDIAPQLSVYAVFSDRIVISVDNTNSFSSAVKYRISVSNKENKVVSASAAKKVNIYDNGKYIKPRTNYTVTVTPVNKQNEAIGVSASIKVKTAEFTYYTIKKGVDLYKFSGTKMKKKTTASAKTYAKGRQCTANAMELAGASAAKYSGEYVKILDGDYKGYYMKSSDTSRADTITAQRYIVTAYGKSMHGGKYVPGGASYRRTDCSGLTMQCYALIGKNITHSVYLQAQKGKKVSVNKMQPGDLIILNNRSHVAMYIGNDKMVHAMNSRDGIKVEPISKLKYYRLDMVRRIIY